jgi:hypothetical protein
MQTQHTTTAATKLKSTLRLLAVGQDAKTVKGEKKGILTGILYLSPASMSGKNLCTHASAGCRAACLNTAGRGKFTKTQAARLRKSRWLIEDPKSFKAQLEIDIRQLALDADLAGYIPAVRLNGTSDIRWETVAPEILALCDKLGVKIYDYTKNPARAIAQPYNLTFSRSECNEAKCLEVLKAGQNVAVVFSKELPATWNGYPVINGDENDLRFLDPAGVVVGLKAKGQAKRDRSGFVVD